MIEEFLEFGEFSVDFFPLVISATKILAFPSTQERKGYDYSIKHHNHVPCDFFCDGEYDEGATELVYRLILELEQQFIMK